MTTPLISENRMFSRLFRGFLMVALAVGATALHAQQSRLVGHWRGTDGRTTVSILISPDGRYIQHAQSGARMIRETGWAHMAGTNRISFNAASSLAKAPQHVHTSSLIAIQKAEMPLHSTNSISYKGAGKLVLTDEATHHSITMIRVH